MSEKASETVGQVRARIRRDRATIERAQERLVTNLRRALELGASAPDLAEDSGYTLSRVGQLVGGVRRVRAAAGTTAPKRRAPRRDESTDTAEETPAETDAADPPASPESDELPDRYRPGAIERVHELLHADGLVTDHFARRYEERPTVFVEVDSGEWWSPAGKHGHIEWREGSAAELLAGLSAEPLATVQRVYFVGSHRPGVDPKRHLPGTAADAARKWILRDVPGWKAGGHYLKDDTALIGRWEREGRTVEVHRAHTWFDEGVYSARDAALAWAVLRRTVAAEFRGAVLLSTPGTTGSDLLRRTIPEKGAGFPVLSAELRDLIISTSGQSREELFTPKGPGRLPVVTQWDMRFAYAALSWGMPVGAPTMVTRGAWDAMTDDEQSATLARRGRWLVRATVPGGWDHVGILPMYVGSSTGERGRTKAWPSKPGTTFTSWCSASELAVARLYGWRVDVLEGFHFTEGKPLNTWKDKLISVRDAEHPDVPPHVVNMIRNAVRAMTLSTIGTFHARAHLESRSVPVGQESALPDDAPIREVDGMYTWEERGERSPWMERMSHPEWSAEIYGRCRTRLLTTPPVLGVKTGALHVAPGTVIGMRTDGITLSVDPGWPDDGKVGRYRLEGRMRGAFEWPTTDAALSELKRTAKGAYETGEMQ